MSFYGSSFSFNGVSCEEFGLMLYDFNNTRQGDSEYSRGINIVEDRIPHRIKPLYYGTHNKNPLEFTLVFGEGQRASTNGQPIDRQKMELIGSWLLDQDGYKWLTVDQPDMEDVRYRCILTDLKTVEFAGNKWAFTCKVSCDSPYAYTYPQNFIYKSNSSESPTSCNLFSRSSCNKPYLPTVRITINNGNSVSIKNITDDNREFKLTNLSTSSTSIIVDGETGTVRDQNGLDLYSNFNFVFPRLIRGNNQLEITGGCDIEYVCEFPVNIGG